MKIGQNYYGLVAWIFGRLLAGTFDPYAPAFFPVDVDCCCGFRVCFATAIAVA